MSPIVSPWARALFDMPMGDANLSSEASPDVESAASVGGDTPQVAHFDSKDRDGYDLTLAEQGTQGIEWVERALQDVSVHSPLIH